MLSFRIVVFLLMMMIIGATIGQFGEFEWPPDEYDENGNVIKEDFGGFSKHLDEGKTEAAKECRKCQNADSAVFGIPCIPDKYKEDANHPNVGETPEEQKDIRNCKNMCHNRCRFGFLKNLTITTEAKTILETFLYERWYKSYEKNKTVSASEKERVLKLYRKARKRCLTDCDTLCGTDATCSEGCKKKCGTLENAGFFTSLSPTLFISALIVLSTKIF